MLISPIVHQSKDFADFADSLFALRRDGRSDDRPPRGTQCQSKYSRDSPLVFLTRPTVASVFVVSSCLLQSPEVDVIGKCSRLQFIDLRRLRVQCGVTVYL